MHDQFILSPGSAYSLVGVTGTMAASLAANSIVFAMGATANPTPTSVSQNLQRGPVVVDGIRATFTGIVASAAPFTAGRALALYKASDNAQTMPGGGTALTPIAKRTKDAGGDTALQGAQIAGTAGLTVVGFARGSVQVGYFDLAGGGSAGARLERHWRFALEAGHLQLDPGEILVLSNPAIFDALLTWQLSVEVDYHRRDGY